jgi:RNA polymerase-binding transcription factor DksA
MTEAEIQTFRRTLLDLGRRLRGDEAGLYRDALRPVGVAGSTGSIYGPGDAGDQSVDAATQDVSLELLGNERQLLAQVTAALNRIERGTYGRCIVCGHEISTARLQALPYTPHCVNCARRVEEGTNPASPGVSP